MATGTQVRELARDDCDALARVTGRDPALYRQYVSEQEDGARTVLVALLDDELAGCLTIERPAGHPALSRQDVPEITDLLVFPELRRRGVGSVLMEEAERRVAVESDTVGVAVGLSSAHGAAHVFLAGRGYVPDGKGVTYRGREVDAGATVAVDEGLLLVFVKTLGE